MGETSKITKKQALEKGKENGYDIAMSNQNEFFEIGEEEFFSEVIETETENFRQYSPFEFFAKLLNDSKNPDVYWQAYENGVSIGAKKAIRELRRKYK